jgi:hypothetical protein
MLTANNLINACSACLLGICTEYTINPNELKDLETNNSLDLSNLSDQMFDQLSEHHYIALYFNRDEPTIQIEKTNSHEELLNLYDTTQNDFESGDNKTLQVTIDGTNYTIDLLADI